jgi:hypothetical protein
MLSIFILASLASFTASHESVGHTVINDLKSRGKQAIRDHIDQVKYLDNQASVSSISNHAIYGFHGEKDIHSRDFDLPPARLRYDTSSSSVNYTYMKSTQYDTSTCSGDPTSKIYFCIFISESRYRLSYGILL